MQQTENLAPHVQEIARALQNRMEPDAIEDELRRYLDYGVPLAQAKRDIVRMHGGTLTAGEKRINTLVAEDRGVELKVKVLTVNPKEITVKGAPKQIFYGYMADATGRTPYTAWKDFNLQPGTVYKIKNAYAKKGFRDPVDVQLGDYTQVAATDEQMEVANDFAPAPAASSGASGGSSRVSTERAVKELRDGMGSVALTVRILDAATKTVSTATGPKTLVEGEMADATGRVRFSAWEPEKLPAEFKADAVVRVKNAYIRAFRGVPQVSLGQYTIIEILSPDALPERGALMEAKPYTLGELEAAGGASGVEVRGILLEVKKGSGLIFRCAQEGCSRVLQKMECRLHGKQKGTPDLRVKAVLDDGHGAATFFIGREATERVLGKTLAQCQEMAREAMTVDVIQDELMQKLTAKRIIVRGNATSDEFGLQIIASSLDFEPARDAQAEAEKLIGQVVEVLQEVA